ncbi:hypothetical protein [Spirochaeta dissipatitropha]
MEKDKVYPGLNPSVVTTHLRTDERQIVDLLSKEQYVTNGGKEISLSTQSKYRYFLFKPTTQFAQQFNIELEIICLFSDYEDFQPRTIDAFSHIYSKVEDYRLERICSVLISRDPQISNKIIDLLKADPESPNIIPFTYRELIQNLTVDPYFFRNRFREHLYSRDLFDFKGPLKKDLYFYGRSEIINDVLSRHKSNENFGIFGLRRTGKTSIVFGVSRAVRRVNSFSVFIDCQNTSFNQRRWNKALYFVIRELKSQNNIDCETHQEQEYSIENTGIFFEEDLKSIVEHLSANKLIIIIDEIERITFDSSTVSHWKDGDDFIYFWQTIRAIYQKTDFFTLLIAGTNPRSIEQPRINGSDNPIFNQITYSYVPGFNVQQTRDMVRKLGRIMGITFKETIYSKLNEDYGGHPFLIRQICSLICREFPARPYHVDKSTYSIAKKLFSEKTEYIEMIIGVLQEEYEDEYSLLEFLALEDLDTFRTFADGAPEMIQHLLGYGIIEKVNNNYDFIIEEIREYLIKKNKYRLVTNSSEARLNEISTRRNTLEKELRIIVRQTLQSHLGRNAIDEVISALKDSDKKKAKLLSYKDLFDPQKNNIYFNNLITIIDNNWNAFQNIFQKDKNELINILKAINKFRVDAHAGEISDADFNYLRGCFGAIEETIAFFT